MMTTYPLGINKWTDTKLTNLFDKLKLFTSMLYEN